MYYFRWLKEFPLAQFHFVDGQKLIDNPADEVKKVEEFLRLKSGENAENSNTLLPDRNIQLHSFRESLL